ncbi:MAG: chromosome segregation protein SMC, partial [Rhodocyclaceae bacterium]|nr:chromosome segregation protein SMC [Rhodocyclaceae bacterium]
KMTVYAGEGADAAAPSAYGDLRPLASCVRGRNAAATAALCDWLQQVYIVTSRDAGLAQRHQLPPGGLLVSADGHVFTRHSVSFHAPDSDLHGVLSRERELDQLSGQLAVEQNELAARRARHVAADTAFEQHQTMLADLRQALDGTRRQCHEAELEITRFSEQAQRITQRGEQIGAELAEIDAQTGQERAQHDLAQASVAQCDKQRIDLQGQLGGALTAYAGADAALEQQRQAIALAERNAQEASFHLKTCVNKIAEIDNAMRLVRENVGTLQAGIARHEAERADLDETPLTVELDRVLQIRTQKELSVASARDALEAAETALRQTEQDRLLIEPGLDPIRERIGDARLKEQEARLIEEQFSQQLFEVNANESELEPHLEKGKRASALQADITRLSNEIAALGAVNLAALDELETSRQRKEYLDSQSLDLNTALATLEDAIHRIDRETRERLQHTFDVVNGHFGELFPSLFGGGQARLILSGEEILDAGVQVVAQPPGKKNSSIHLLSGGEKALTALSLVFALFQLNPAPFCLLDEVDAPLDDSNTERFCGLVKKMSANSQFMFISHNKITMELANQLIGITMQEAGVSRVVAVDIEEAMKLAEVA